MSKVKIIDELIKRDDYSTSFNSAAKNFSSAEEVMFVPEIYNVTGTGTLDLSFQTAIANNGPWIQIGVSKTYDAKTDSPEKREIYSFTNGLLKYFRVSASISGATFDFEVKVVLRSE